MFDDEILRILTEAGAKGLKTEKIARNVFNACNSMFNPLDYEDVHAYVTQYLLKNSKNPDSIIEKAEWGVYRINLWSKDASQLMLKFTDNTDEPEEKAPADDKSLSLF